MSINLFFYQPYRQKNLFQILLMFLIRNKSIKKLTPEKM